MGRLNRSLIIIFVWNISAPSGKYFADKEKRIIFAAETETNSVMVRKYNNKEELTEAFKHAVGAREAFEDLVHGRIDKSEFESKGYKLMQVS